jgi:hypothetical protein
MGKGGMLRGVKTLGLGQEWRWPISCQRVFEAKGQCVSILHRRKKIPKEIE